jgi:hypothetical protein
MSVREFATAFLSGSRLPNLDKAHFFNPGLRTVPYALASSAAGSLKRLCQERFHGGDNGWQRPWIKYNLKAQSVNKLKASVFGSPCLRSEIAAEAGENQRLQCEPRYEYFGVLHNCTFLLRLRSSD